MVWESEIYPLNTVKYCCPYLERHIDDMVDVFKWLGFELYYSVWFWNNQSDDTKLMSIQRLGLSNRDGSGICHWMMNEKREVL